MWRDWLIFTAGELVYFVAIWWHLGGFLTPGDEGADRIYWLAVIIRLATQRWIVIMVVRDVLRPDHDPVAPAVVTTRPAECWTGPDVGWWPARRCGRVDRSLASDRPFDKLRAR